MHLGLNFPFSWLPYASGISRQDWNSCLEFVPLLAPCIMCLVQNSSFSKIPQSSSFTPVTLSASSKRGFVWINTTGFSLLSYQILLRSHRTILCGSSSSYFTSVPVGGRSQKLMLLLAWPLKIAYLSGSLLLNENERRKVNFSCVHTFLTI